MSTALARRRSRGSPPVTMPSLAARLGLDSGVHRLLETPLSINGAEGSTILRFLGSQAAAGGWPEYGGAGTLSLQAGTAPSYNQNAPWLSDSAETGCKFNGGGYFLSPSTTVGDITTHDLVVEAVVRWSSIASKYWFGKYTTPNNGYLLYSYSTPTTLSLFLADGTNYTQTYLTGLTDGGVYHILYTADRSGSSIGYANATAGSAVGISSVGSMTTGVGMHLGASAAGASNSSIGVLYAAVHYRAAGWLDSHLQPTVAAQRFALLTASRPSFSVVPSTYPSAKGSTSPVYQQRRLASGSDQLFYMGAAAPTFDRIVDAAGRAVVGHLVEAAAENLFTYGSDLSSWTAPTRASITTTAFTCPDGVSRTTSTIHEDATAANTHYALRACTLADATQYTWSLFVKPLNRTWLRLVVSSAAAYINLSGAGSVGTTAGGAVARVKSIGGGVYYVEFVHTTASGSGAYNHAIFVSDGDGDTTVDGLDQDDYQIFGCQSELGPCGSSVVVTAAAAVTRAASSLKYSTANCLPRSEGSIVGAILCRSFTPTRARVLFSLDDASANNRVELFTTATTGLLSALSRKASGTSGDVELTAHGSVYDNKIRPFLLTWNAAELALWVRDPTTRAWSVARDTSITPVAGSTFTTLCVGHDNATANHAGPGAYPLADWALLPDHYDDPSQVRRADSTLWEAY